MIGWQNFSINSEYLPLNWTTSRVSIIHYLWPKFSFTTLSYGHERGWCWHVIGNESDTWEYVRDRYSNILNRVIPFPPFTCSFIKVGVLTVGRFSSSTFRFVNKKVKSTIKPSRSLRFGKIVEIFFSSTT